MARSFVQSALMDNTTEMSFMVARVRWTLHDCVQASSTPTHLLITTSALHCAYPSASLRKGNHCSGWTPDLPLAAPPRAKER